MLEVILKRTGMAGRVREAIKSLEAGGREIASKTLAIELDMVSDREKQVMYRVIRDFVRAGEISRVRRGVFVCNHKSKQPELQEVMWRYLRIKKTVTIDDLIAVSRASREYAAEWVYMLVRREIVEMIRLGGARKYRLISDPVIMPVNEDNAKKLRKLRKRKKREIRKKHCCTSFRSSWAGMMIPIGALSKLMPELVPQVIQN
jgi:hypothetical protein